MRKSLVIEPLIQGAAGMWLQPPGYLKAVEQVCRQHDVLLICDEVATGFGRTGTMFAVEQEDVRPDFLCLAKGLTGGYLPLAATLIAPSALGISNRSTAKIGNIKPASQREMGSKCSAL